MYKAQVPANTCVTAVFSVIGHTNLGMVYT